MKKEIFRKSKLTSIQKAFLKAPDDAHFKTVLEEIGYNLSVFMEMLPVADKKKESI